MNGPVVLKLGGDVVRGAEMPAIAHDIASLVGSGRPLVVVHGGGPQATELSTRLGVASTIVAGRRVTDAPTLEVMKMAVAGQVNVDLCTAIYKAGAKPVGLHGASAGVVRAVKRPARVVSGGGSEAIDFGHVGDVVGINSDLLRLLVANQYVPVIACLGANDEGAVFNINADAVANHVAIALGARALVVISDVPGVLRDTSDPASRFASLTREEATAAIEAGVITKGMIPKVEESFEAIRAGVREVLIVGKLKTGELVRALTQEGSFGTVLRG